MINCSCLIKLNENLDEILLVRVRDNQKWYLPGGKIEANESAEDALIRELNEELGITINRDSLMYITTITDQAYGIDDTVSLTCFSATFDDEIQALGEISEVRFVNWSTENDLLAPAVQKLCSALSNR